MKPVQINQAELERLIREKWQREIALNFCLSLLSEEETQKFRSFWATIDPFFPNSYRGFFCGKAEGKK